MKRLLGLMGLLLLAALLTGVAYAQQPVSDDEVNAVAKKLYCPVCENTPLDVCPTQACKDWRALIRQQLGEGWTEEQILDYFAANYGSWVLAQPPARGFTALVWILPLVGLVAGGAFLWRLLRRGQERHRPPEGPVAAEEATGPPPGVSAEVLARIEREVEARF
jgi:cytochrome c-type biogenesis protein CcmH